MVISIAMVTPTTVTFDILPVYPLFTICYIIKSESEKYTQKNIINNINDVYYIKMSCTNIINVGIMPINPLRCKCINVSIWLLLSYYV